MATPDQMIKFALRIRTRSGLPVDNLLVQARDRNEAERRITQMYPHCEILECKEIHPSVQWRETWCIPETFQKFGQEPCRARITRCCPPSWNHGSR